MKPPDLHNRQSLYLIVTLITISVWAVVALFPEGRTWGFAVWAWPPRETALIVLGLASLVALGLYFRLDRRSLNPAQPVEPPSLRKSGWLIPTALAIVLPLFWFARVRTHFLGDGYNVLSLLTSDQPFIKISQIGEALAHIWVKELSGLQGEAAALFSFRFVSILAGALLTAAVVWIAAHLFERLSQRLLFTGGLLTGGYMLLYFGYAENYSLLTASVGVFTLIGLLVARGRIRRVWLILPLAAAIFFHIMGVTLIPAAAFLLIAPSRLGRRMTKWPPRTRAVAALLCGGAAIAAFLWAVRSSMFFRYSILPPIEGRFTAGYTLFSPAHLIDFVNLLFVLLPATGLLVLILAHNLKSLRPLSRELLFLTILILSSLGAAFVFDPKLGMPRDWDLFSFAGIPLVITFYYLALHHSRSTRHGAVAAAFGIVLGAVALSGRVATQFDEAWAIPQFRHYMALDPARMAGAFHTLRDYYLKEGDIAAADSVEMKWQEKHPESVLAARAEELLDAGRHGEATPLAQRAIDLNPTYWSAYSNLAHCMIESHRFDSAIVLLKIADGINPNNPKVIHNLAYCYAWQRDFDKAERLWQKAFRLDTTQTSTLLQLGRLYEMTNRPDKAIATLEHMARQPNPLPEGLAMLAARYARGNRYPEAGEMLRRAVLLGLDSTEVNRYLAAHPRLKSFLPNTE